MKLGGLCCLALTLIIAGCSTTVTKEEAQTNALNASEYPSRIETFRSSLNTLNTGTNGLVRHYVDAAGAISNDDSYKGAYCQVTVAFWDLSRVDQQFIEHRIVKLWAKISNDKRESWVHFSDQDKLKDDMVFASDCGIS